MKRSDATNWRKSPPVAAAAASCSRDLWLVAHPAAPTAAGPIHKHGCTSTHTGNGTSFGSGVYIDPARYTRRLFIISQVPRNICAQFSFPVLDNDMSYPPVKDYTRVPHNVHTLMISKLSSEITLTRDPDLEPVNLTKYGVQVCKPIGMFVVSVFFLCGLPRGTRVTVVNPGHILNIALVSQLFPWLTFDVFGKHTGAVCPVTELRCSPASVFICSRDGPSATPVKASLEHLGRLGRPRALLVCKWDEKEDSAWCDTIDCKKCLPFEHICDPPQTADAFIVPPYEQSGSTTTYAIHWYKDYGASQQSVLSPTTRNMMYHNEVIRRVMRYEQPHKGYTDYNNGKEFVSSSNWDAQAYSSTVDMYNATSREMGISQDIYSPVKIMGYLVTMHIENNARVDLEMQRGPLTRGMRGYNRDSEFFDLS